MHKCCHCVCAANKMLLDDSVQMSSCRSITNKQFNDEFSSPQNNSIKWKRIRKLPVESWMIKFVRNVRRQNTVIHHSNWWWMRAVIHYVKVALNFYSSKVKRYAISHKCAINYVNFCFSLQALAHARNAMYCCDESIFGIKCSKIHKLKKRLTFVDAFYGITIRR